MRCLYLFCMLATIWMSCNNTDATKPKTVKTIKESEPKMADLNKTTSEVAVKDIAPEADTVLVFSKPENLNTDTANKGFWEEKNTDLSTLLMSRILKDPEKRNALTEILLKTERQKQHREMAGMAGMEEDEIRLLQQLPTKEFINNEQRANAVVQGVNSIDIDKHIQSGKSTDLFKKIVEQQNKSLLKHSQAMIKKAALARDVFHKANPNINLSSSNTYFDEKKNAVHLPLGELSFADEVVSHVLGKPEGKYADRALGKPDYTGDETKNIAHIGLGGMLTLYFKDNAIVDVEGPDIYVFEVGAIEPTTLEISKDGQHWIKIGKINGGTAEVDISGYVPAGENYHYVRFTDLKSPSDIPGADIDAVAAIGSVMRLTLNSSVLFDFGKYALKEEAAGALEALANKIKSLPGGIITVEGHTDDIGQDEDNKILSERRAESVSIALKKRIPDSIFRWKIIGFGESRPYKPNDTEEHRQENRRVEILVTPQN